MKEASNGQWLCPDCGGVGVESCVCKENYPTAKGHGEFISGCCGYHTHHGMTRLGPDGCAGPWERDES